MITEVQRISIGIALVGGLPTLPNKVKAGNRVFGLVLNRGLLACGLVGEVQVPRALLEGVKSGLKDLLL